MFRTTSGWNYKLPCVTTVTAAFDDTKVRFTLGGTIFTKTKGGMKPGQIKEWSLMKGDVLAISNDTDEGDLSGSKVVSTKPVAVTTGNMCANIPTGNQWCDYTAEMDIPTFAWGKNLHIGKIFNRTKASIVRIFAKEPNTKIYRNGLNIGTIATAGGVEGKGFQVMRMTQDSKPGSVVFSGDKPITVTLYNTGIQEDGYPLPNSDPFVMSTIPVEQYQKEIYFCTPGIKDGKAFKENYVNLVYETNSLGMMPDDMEIAGPVHGEAFTWKKVSEEFSGMDELFKHDVNGKKYAIKLIMLPGDGVYSIRSQTPFAAYGFGYDSQDSYGYPLAAAFTDIEKADTIPPVPTYTLNCDGSISDGVVTDMPDDDAIRSNLSTIVFQSSLSFNYIFQYVGFETGKSRTTSWTLQVIDPSQDAKA
ncbi:MAG: IgGFc-binding protein, partial [Ignavibacteria bacterium]|nr:IgGFc-binding protein [Ignavibacteria bacterium]